MLFLKTCLFQEFNVPGKTNINEITVFFIESKNIRSSETNVLKKVKIYITTVIFNSNCLDFFLSFVKSNINWMTFFVNEAQFFPPIPDRVLSVPLQTVKIWLFLILIFFVVFVEISINQIICFIIEKKSNPNKNNISGGFPFPSPRVKIWLFSFFLFFFFFPFKICFMKKWVFSFLFQTKTKKT